MAETEKTEEAESTEQVEAKTDEIPQDVLEANAKFDEAVADEVNESEEEVEEEKTDDDKAEKKDEGKTEDKAADEEIPAKEDKTKTEEEDSGTVKKTAKTEDAPILDDSLVDRAVKAGLPFSLVKNADPAQLETEVALLEKKADETEEKEPEKFDCKLDPGVVDPAVIEAINKLGQTQLDKATASDAENKKLREEIATSAQATKVSGQQQARNSMDRTMDGFFNGMEGFEKTFGKGKISDMEEGSPEFKARMAVEDKMLVLLRGYTASEQDVPDDAELFKQALQINHSKETRQAADKKTVAKLKKQAKQTIGKSQSGGEHTTKMDAAVQAGVDFDKKVNEEVDD